MASKGRPPWPRRRAVTLRLLLGACALLSGCAGAPVFPPAAPNTGKRAAPTDRDFRASDLAKSDIDTVGELHVHESLASARLLMEKLYRRNPREWRKGGDASAAAALARAFDPRSEFRFAELGQVRGAEAILLALKPDYGGDRVFAFGVGISSMIFLAYNGKTEFYVTDVLDAQKLYNCARNLEIAAWKLANARDARGDPLLLSNELAGEVRNLSFEREFGKMIAYQDVMAEITAQRTNRTIRHVVQSVATAVFLPI
ncbi:MAG TPA: hypothetical protein VF959_04760 [Casimicrobiaceae bacterium]